MAPRNWVRTGGFIEASAVRVCAKLTTETDADTKDLETGKL
jgi:hypothetical protein